MNEIKVFDYIPELDAFLPTKEYAAIVDELGLSEWTHVVWIGRLFTGDADFGEHWFDNWDERNAIAEKAQKLGYEENSLYIIDPKKFASGEDGPSHTDAQRKMFWTDVLRSLTLSIDTIAEFARVYNPPVGDSDHVTNIKKKVKALKERYSFKGID